MSELDVQEKQQAEVYTFMAEVFGVDEAEFLELIDHPPGLEFSAAIPLKNEPELWADAPWRVEPGIDELPLLFVIRDGDVQPPGKGPWRIRSLSVEQRRKDGSWHPVCTLLPQDLPGVDDAGNVEHNFWSHSIQIPLVASDSPYKLVLDELERGGAPLHLRILFVGSFSPYDKVEAPEIHLETYLAEHALPLRQASTRRWFYGDTHYHSAYTNDVKEFGGPVAASREAGRAIGLDWLAITDHSCDLDERDGSPTNPSRWQRLAADVSSHELSDERFRLIHGEEITLRGGKGERYLHMLAMGGMADLMPGGFLPESGGGFVTQAFKKAIEKFLNHVSKHGGYAPDLTRRLFGEIHMLGDVLDRLPEATLTFAAHPTTAAQPPFVHGEWIDADLDHPRLTGMEFWNGRARRTALLTSDPFSVKSWTDPEATAKADRKRIGAVREFAEERWDLSLVRGLGEWSRTRQPSARPPVFVGGSDAHGSFNYSVGWGWDYRRQTLIDDNALGRVRTAVYLPNHAAATVPETSEILAALKHGACIVTDGPVLELSLSHGGSRAYLGDWLEVDGTGDVEVEVLAYSTPELGDVEELEVVTYFEGQPGGKPAKTTVRAGQSASITVQGHGGVCHGFCRVQAETVGREDERFCCFTNPIWVRLAEGQGARLHVKVTSILEKSTR